MRLCSEPPPPPHSLTQPVPTGRPGSVHAPIPHCLTLAWGFWVGCGMWDGLVEWGGTGIGGPFWGQAWVVSLVSGPFPPLHHCTIAPLHHYTIMTPTTTTKTTGTHGHVRPACACAHGGAWHLAVGQTDHGEDISTEDRCGQGQVWEHQHPPCRVWLVWWTMPR